jgi:hypothetical protein
MATANPAKRRNPSTRRPPRRPWLRRLGWLALALALAALAWWWRPLHDAARTGASFGARVGCSCRFVGGRPLADCRKDFEPGMELVTLSEDPAAKSVTASFPLLARQTATFHEGAGCVLEPWRD